MTLTADLARSQTRYACRVPGYYAVNPRTNLAVAGPYEDEAQAAKRAFEINTTPPTAPDPLQVVRIGGSDD